MVDDIPYHAAILREGFCFLMGFAAGCLWVVLGVAVVQSLSRKKRIARKTMTAGQHKSRRKGEVHSAIIFVVFAVASLLPTFLLLVNAKSPTEPAPMAMQTVDPQDEPADELSLALGTYDHPKTAAYCIAGAVLGAILSLTIFPGKAETNAGVIRQLAAKFGSSMAVAVAFGPMSMDYFGVTRLNSMLAVSATLSLFGVSAIHQVGPTAVTWIVSKVKTFLGIQDNEPK